ncbi:hypothetical protein GC167_07750 [bacterium]|nr:hypothetical protein [bacterium]
MNGLYLIGMSMLVGGSLCAQDSVWHRYHSGEASCLEVFEGPDAYGRTESGVWVYNKVGGLVFRGVRRNYAGHASVRLDFHSNGGVARIEASSAPDAGIQWYRERMDLDEEGHVVYHQKQSHEDLERVTIPEPWVAPENPVSPVVPEPQGLPEACAVPHGGRAVFINAGKRKGWIRMFRTDRPQPELLFEGRWQPGDSLCGPLMIRADRHPLPLESLKVEVRDHRRRAWKTAELDEWALRTRQTPTGLRYELYGVD